MAPAEGAGRPPPVPRPRLRKRDLPRDDLGRLRAPGEPDAMAHLKRAQQDPPELARTRELARHSLAERRFFEAVTYCDLIRKHPATPPGRQPVWRALAQVAAGLCHLQRGNAAGALAVLDRGVDGLAAHREAAWPGLEALERTVTGLLAELHAADADDAAPDPPPIDLVLDPEGGAGSGSAGGFGEEPGP